MAGKVTYLHGRHPSQGIGRASVDGGWVPDELPPVRPSAWHDAERALGERLTERQRVSIVESLALHRHFIHSSRDLAVPRQDQLRTLSAAAKLPETELRAAFKNMDEQTHRLIMGELYRAGARRYDELEHPVVDALRAAIVAALENWESTAGGPSSDAPRMLARAVWCIWRDLGGGPAHTPETADSVRFAVALFAIAGIHRSPITVMKLLREAR